MKEFIDKYHLRAGFLIAIVFPGIFVFSEPTGNTSDIILSFFSSFSFIFLLWTTDFVLVDFKNRSSRKKAQTKAERYLRIAATFLTASFLYVTIGLTLNSSFLDPIRGENMTSVQAWFFFTLRLFLFNVLILLVKFLFDNNEEKQQIQMENELLKRENLNARHETLKQQVTPHFLFNSLNTLRSLIKRDSNQAINFSSELSRVYRYMLRHREKREVRVREEIDFVQSYLYLLKIRFEGALYTDIEIPEPFLDYMMPPITLQLLVENAAKHNRLSQKSPLVISIYADEEYLVVKNNLQLKEEHDNSSNVGLMNINSRYKLLKNKEIIIQQNDHSFRVLLPLQ